jgi:hypothetical protein
MMEDSFFLYTYQQNIFIYMHNAAQINFCGLFSEERAGKISSCHSRRISLSIILEILRKFLHLLPLSFT